MHVTCVIVIATLAFACGAPKSVAVSAAPTESDRCAEETAMPATPALFYVDDAPRFELARSKPKIAVLGLETVVRGAKADAEDLRVATDLTVVLRVRPKAGQGPFQYAPNSERELIDEKIRHNCETEEVSCMAAIGADMGANVLMYGRIERKTMAGSAGYQIWLRLLDVDSKRVSASWTDFIPLHDSQSSTKLADWGRRGYKKLTNENEGGTLVVVVKNAERGVILIDGEERATITNNRGEVTALAEGRYRVAVVASGFHRWTSDEPIRIENGSTYTEEISLRPCK